MSKHITGVYGALEIALRYAENLAALVGGALLVISMFLTSADALLRYTVTSPLWFSFYLTENYILVGMLSLPLAWGFRNGGYIRISALLLLLPKTAGDVLLRLGLFAGCVYVAVLAWLSGLRFVESYVRGAVQMGVIDWPVAWSWVWLPIGLGLLSLRLVFTATGPSSTLKDADESFEDEL